ELTSPGCLSKRRYKMKTFGEPEARAREGTPCPSVTVPTRWQSLRLKQPKISVQPRQRSSPGPARGGLRNRRPRLALKAARGCPPSRRRWLERPAGPGRCRGAAAGNARWATPRLWPCSHFRRKPGSLARGVASISITLLVALSAEQPSHHWSREEAEHRGSCTAMGNTTSDRVAGERHGAKAARAEGAGSHAPGKEHKIMVGSTDDPSVFSLPDSKLPGDKEFVSWQQDLEDSVKPTQQARPTVIRWSEGGKEVFISGSFNNWSTKIPLIKSHNDFVAILDLPEGEHQYKFFVDGQWVHDPSEPVVTSQLGTINNLIHVKKSDFEVFDALKLDSMESSETSCRGPYGQEMYVFRSEERFKSPPILPPHLLQVILNKDTNISCDPALLPEPNHVMLNHLYALSIKDSVMVLSATHRYKKKYVTTLLYKPI
ncbi:hypothetical protein EI555_019782, partial [Monodon monoceros]